MCQLVPYAPVHKEGVIRVVRRVYDEYAFTWEADGYHRDLYDIETYYLDRGGMFWVLLAEDMVVGCVGVAVHGEESELHRMYLFPEFRGRGLGRKMLEAAIEYARAKGCRAMRAWSDVKLTDAHRLYLRSGFVHAGERICDDPDKSREYGFWKEPL
jgi:putative acetyltransferase